MTGQEGVDCLIRELTRLSVPTTGLFPFAAAFCSAFKLCSKRTCSTNVVNQQPGYVGVDLDHHVIYDLEQNFMTAVVPGDYRDTIPSV